MLLLTSSHKSVCNLLLMLAVHSTLHMYITPNIDTANTYKVLLYTFGAGCKHQGTFYIRSRWCVCLSCLLFICVGNEWKSHVRYHI